MRPFLYRMLYIQAFTGCRSLQTMKLKRLAKLTLKGRKLALQMCSSLVLSENITIPGVDRNQCSNVRKEEAVK